MSEVMNKLLEKYPVYKEVNRDTLIDAIGRKYPAYLEQPDFKEEFDALQALNKSVQETPAPAVAPTPEPSVPASQAFDRLFAKPTPAAASAIPETTASPLTEGAAAQADILRTGVSHGTVVLGDTSSKPILSLPKPEIFASDPDRLKVAKGMATAISAGLESVFTEQGLEQIAVAGPMAPLVFGTLGTIGTIKGLSDIFKSKTPEERGKAIGETILNAGMAELSRRSATIKAPEILIPRTSEALGNVIQEGAPNASSISTTVAPNYSGNRPGIAPFFDRQSETQGLERVGEPTHQDILNQRADTLRQDRIYLRDLRESPNDFLDEFNSDPIVDEVAEAAADLVKQVKIASEKKLKIYNPKETEEGIIALTRMMKGEATEVDVKAARRFLDPTQNAISDEIEMEMTTLPLDEARQLTPEKVMDFAADYAASAYGLEKSEARAMLDYSQAQKISKLVRDEAEPQYQAAVIKLGNEMRRLAKSVSEREAPRVNPFFDRRSEAQGLGELSTAPGLAEVRAQRAHGARTEVPKVEAPAIAEPAKPELPTGPGAARPADVGLGESNIDPLQRVSDAIKTLPAEPKVPLHEQLEDWVSKMAEGTKDNFERAIGTARAGAAWVKNHIVSAPKVEDLDRPVGKWNLADQELSHNSRLFAKVVREKFPRADTLEALTNYIEAEGDVSVLAERAAASKARYKKGYEDAMKLTEDQKRLADEVKYYFEQRLQQAIKAGALEGGVENYIHRFYEADSPQANSILAEINSGKFRTNFEGFKKRFYATDFEAEQAGLKPVKNLAARILHYDQGFNRAMAARAFVKQAYELKASDERPVIDTQGRGDRVLDKDSGDVSAYMVKPHSIKGGDSPLDYRGDYVAFDHPAFRKWVWATADEAGKPIMVEGTLAVHPEYARKFRALFDRSWFSRRKIGRAILVPSSVVKQTMLSISAFHPVQITTHALEHKVSPFKLTEINFKDPAQAELIEGGLMVADHHASQLFSEGVGGVGLTEKIPIVGKWLTAANDWLFKDYIPQVKMTMALHALERNLARYDKDIKAGKVTREQMVRLTARESNAAFGEQNYRAMYRHPTFQDMLRATFLAPDFGEARIRFPAQAATRYGGEQRMALALGAVGLWTIARIANKAVNDDYEWKHPFSLMYKGHEYSLRNVAADIWHLINEPGKYTRNRLNPIYTRAIVEFVTGKDTFGRPRNALEQLQDEAQTIIPISFRSDKERYWWESFLGAIGITNRRFTAETQVREFVKTFNDAQGKKPQIQFIGESDYHQLHRALESADLVRADKELTKLEKLKKAPDILEYFRNYPKRPFTGSKANDQKLLESLSQHERKVFTDAIEERKLIAARFFEVWRKHSKEKKP